MQDAKIAGTRRLEHRAVGDLASAPGAHHSERLVALPPKRDIGYARESKIDDVSAVLRLAHTSGLRSDSSFR